MAERDYCFVEWKEQFISKEKGSRVVHYFLKDSLGEYVLAIVGTERSVRHMFYVVSEDFLKVHGAETSIPAGFRWRSRREVVNWLTSMLSKQNRQSYYSSKLLKDDPASKANFEQSEMTDDKGCFARISNGPSPDIVWSGEPWTCGKQLKHYPSFSRNGITITIHSFVFVMAEENRYLAYLEDMYEDRKFQKKVKVRWFHFDQEVRAIVALRNLNPREVFITSCAQIISAECVDGPAIVLTRAHYHKCAAVFPSDLLSRVHFCHRQFKNKRVKPFELHKLRGYFDQPIFSCFSPDFFEEDEPKVEPERTLAKPLTSKTDDVKIEFLCQDSGLRGCWFRCTVLETSRRQLKIRYDDVKDEDGCGSLEEWVPACRVARPDKLGMRNRFRPTIRPARSDEREADILLELGDAVDAWWSDGWWEGIVIGTKNHAIEGYQVYFPGESRFLRVESKNIRVSKDWVGDEWVDVGRNPDIVPTIVANASKLSQEAKPT